jgi:asparagine synthase (glutamine-hydrolysing)
MCSGDGNLIVTFNGEIYNFDVLRQQLKARGHFFRTKSDTEVLLALYAEKGDAMVHELRGMFAFALWDSRKRALLLVRDPYGIKPLYYADDGSTFRFASQVKALIAGGRISQQREPAGWVGFFLLGSVPDPFTTYRQIRAVPAGSFMWIDETGPQEPRRYFSVSEVYLHAEQHSKLKHDADAHDYFRQAVLDSVRHHLVADVPVGAFLSAGIDSGALVGLMRDAGQQDIQTLTVSFEEFRGRYDDEGPLAATVARTYGTRHTNRVVTEREFHNDLPKILAAMDQPSIDGINVWFVSKGVHELGLKVAISGLGGDELLGGYPTFRNIPRMVSVLRLPSRIPPLSQGLQHVVSGLVRLSKRLNPKLTGLVKHGGSYVGAYLLTRGLFMPWELDYLLDHETVSEGLHRLQILEHIPALITPPPRTAFGKVASLESSLYMRNQLLRDTDWASMAHSLEVRVPLVDAWLLRRVAPILARRRTNYGKALLSASPRTPLPSSITSRRKTGFSIPVGKWLERDPHLQSWKRVPALAGRRCAWARRWAYQLKVA